MVTLGRLTQFWNFYEFLKTQCDINESYYVRLLRVVANNQAEVSSDFMLPKFVDVVKHGQQSTWHCFWRGSTVEFAKKISRHLVRCFSFPAQCPMPATAHSLLNDSTSVLQVESLVSPGHGLLEWEILLGLPSIYNDPGNCW